MAALGDDVAIDSTANDSDSGGGDLTLTSFTVTDGDGLIVMAAVDGADGSRDVDCVTLHAPAFPYPDDLPFIEIGRIDGDDTGANGQDHLLTFWKLDNRAFVEQSVNETHYTEVLIDFTDGGNITYGFVYVLSEQMPDGMLRNWEEIAHNNQTMHGITGFVLEPDAMIISAHFWSAGGSRTASVSETPADWNPNDGTSGLALQHAVPNAAGNKTMSVSFIGGTADTLNAALVVRSANDIDHTPGHTPGTLGDGGSGGYWLEGLIAQREATQGTGDREDISEWGVTHTGKATWIRGDMADGKASSAYRRLTSSQSPGTNEINMTAFSPLNPDREELFAMYLAGLIEDLNDALASDETHRHIGELTNGWADYTGLVVWDLEMFCLHYGGRPEGTNWGPSNVFDPDEAGMLDWEYNAACRYYWERVHQWFVEIFAENVMALVFYHHPQGPRSPNEGLEQGGYNGIDFQGMPWQDQINWVFKMQGAFDGHVYPMAPLTDGQIEPWCTNVLENFRHIYNDEVGVYCYVTNWPSRPQIEAYQTAAAVEKIIDADDAIRNLEEDEYTHFDALYMGVVGLGHDWGDEFAITAVTIGTLGVSSSATVAGEVANKFDPVDLLEISGSYMGLNDHDDYVVDYVAEPFGDTVVYFNDAAGPSIVTSTTPLGDLLAPAKTVDDFVAWWGNIFEDVWTAKFDPP